MTQQEATDVIKAWIETHSPFAAQTIRVTAHAEGVWGVEVECSAAIWRQQVSQSGEVSTPVWVD